MTHVRLKRLRVIPELRAQQVLESLDMTPCQVMYFGENYDLGSARIPPNFVKVGLGRAVFTLLLSEADVLEVPEPLWLRFLPKNVVLLLAWRIGCLTTGKPRYTVTYAIENNDLDTLVGGGKKVPRWFVRAFSTILGRFMSVMFTRIAFGSDAARATYARLALRPTVVTRLFEELPVAQVLGREVPPAHAYGVVFVGRLEERKGVRELMTAWPEVEAIVPAAVLTLLGNGVLQEDVFVWANARPASRRALGRIEHDQVGSIVAANSVLVAPSIPWGRWKEQIGLPIVEGLSHGLTIVTSTETGVATWLRANGHQVVETADLEKCLGPAILNALTNPLARESVRRSLPETDRRTDADRWLHADLGSDR